MHSSRSARAAKPQGTRVGFEQRNSIFAASNSSQPQPPRAASNGFQICRRLARNSPYVNPLCTCLMPLTCTVVPHVLAWRVSMELRKGLETDEFCGRRHRCLSTPRCCVIEAIETRTIKGEQKEYLVLKVAQGDLTVRVPADNAEYVGVRDVVGQEGLDKVFQVLRAPHTEEPTNWSRRYKANLEKLASGDVNKVAEVVRDLWRRDQERGLSAGEKRMLAKARQILVGELALAESTDEAKADTILDEVLAAAS
jgi:CarD family transcriptional regulator